MARPLFIAQPGAAQSGRIVAVACRAQELEINLWPGQRLLEAVSAGFSAAGFASGVATFETLALGPFGYVMPSLAPDLRHAAYYSAPFRPAGVSRTRCGTMTFGQRDGQPFYHAHALWQEADGSIHGGHILPEETVLAEGARIRAFGLSGAGFVARPDHEINFTVFEPEAAPPVPAEASRNALALRLRPNQDFASAIESLCRQHGIGAARLVGGVGSTIGAGFSDGRSVEPWVTEIFLRAGHVGRGADGLPQAQLDIGLVAMDGQVSEGRLTRGDNPVLMTMELVLLIEG